MEQVQAKRMTVKNGILGYPLILLILNMNNSSFPVSDFSAELKLRGFKAYEVDSKAAGHNYSRKDFYKISLTSGKYVFHYVDRSFETDEPIYFLATRVSLIPVRS
ncbi:MAG TPA: hypothetical protein VIU12_18295 [Chryseolinea sp.]